MCPVRTSSCWGISKRKITGTMFYWPPPLIIIGPARTWSELILCVAEYASVGYMAKRIQMRKNRFLAIQKMAEQKKKEIMNAATNANNVGHDQGLPKQSVRDLLITNDDMTLWIFPHLKQLKPYPPARLKHYRIFRSDTAVFLSPFNHGFFMAKLTSNLYAMGTNLFSSRASNLIYYGADHLK